MKKSSYISLLIVTVITIIMIMTVTSFAKNNNDYSYTILYDETLKITGYTGNSTDLEIPSTIDNYPVSAIGNNAFYDNDDLQSITIPNSVISIDKEAFAYCSNLQSITLPNSIEIIYYRAFQDCTNLKNMYYKGTADDWVKIVFDGCDSNPMYYAENEYFNDVLVKNIILSETIIEINDYAFYNCSSLQNITISDSVVFIGNCSFFGCNNLWHVLYKGTETQWNNISIGSNNDCFTNATQHYEVTHNPIIAIITSPTCTKQGYTTYTCECGDSYVDDFVDELGHSYGGWIVTKEATVDTEGEMERVCSCGKKEYISIDKLPLVDNDIEQVDTNKEDVKNPEIPDTNYKSIKIVNSLFMVIVFAYLIIGEKLYCKRW